MNNTKIIVGNRFDALVKALNHSIPSFAKALGYERCDKLYNIQKGKYYPSFEILQDITKYFVEVNTDWIISGRGSMLHDSKTSEEAPMDYGTEKVQSSRHSKNSEETKLGCTPIATPISPAEESIIYKMYKEKDSEVGALKEEIGALKLRIRQLESQDKEPEHHPGIDKALETFTSDLSGSYAEGYLSTNQPTSSKRSSAGKI